MDCVESDLPRLLAADLKRHFRQLVLLYQGGLYSFIARLAANKQEAEDIVQEALLGAYVTLSYYPPERIQALKLRPWLYKIALNIWRNRKRGAHPQLLPLDEVMDDILSAPEEEEPGSLYEAIESSQELQEHLADLSEPYRVVIVGYFFEGLSYQEIADLLDIPIGTVKSRLHRSLSLLRQRMKPRAPERSASAQPDQRVWQRE